LLNENFPLVHGHFGPRLLQGAAFLARGVPMVLSIYGYDASRLLRDPCWPQRYLWAAQNGATLVVLAQSQFERLAALGLPRDRLRRIHLGIRLEEHPFMPASAPAQPRFVFIGRLVEKKGAEFFLRALSMLDKPVHAQVIGSGPLEMELRQLTRDLDLQDRVHFAGAVPFAQLFDYLRQATALVQPSVTARDGDAEGAPMVLMHAQAAGTPCITTSHEGNPEVLPPQAHPWIVPERDAGALAIAMNQMMRLSPPARLALQNAGRQWIQRHYDLARTVAAYDALYREILSAPVNG
jgi:glycosyltransferase involved in cell wall biosynthesis